MNNTSSSEEYILSVTVTKGLAVRQHRINNELQIQVERFTPFLRGKYLKALLFPIKFLGNKGWWDVMRRYIWCVKSSKHIFLPVHEPVSTEVYKTDFNSSLVLNTPYASVNVNSTPESQMGFFLITHVN